MLQDKNRKMDTEYGKMKVMLARSLSTGRGMEIRLEQAEEGTGGEDVETVNTDKSFQWVCCKGEQKNGLVAVRGHGVEGREQTAQS